MPLRTPEGPVTDCDDLDCGICHQDDEFSTDYDLPDDEISEEREVREGFIR